MITDTPARPMTRRPIGTRADPPGTTHDTGDYATFEYRELALDAIANLNAADRYGWSAWPQYTGVWDCWIILAVRRSNRNGASKALRTDGSVR